MKLSFKISAVSSALALTGLFVCGGVAQADTVTTNYTGMSPGGIGVTVTNVAPGSPVVGVNTSAGVFNHTIISSTPAGIDLAPVGNAAFVAFCIDLADYAGNGVTYQIDDLWKAPDPGGDNMGMTKASDLGKLLYSAVGANLSAVSSLDASHAAALQAAVWEVVFEKSGTYSVTGGNLTVTGGSIETQANTYLAGIATATGTMAGLKALTNPDKQDFVVQVVPIPAAAWLFGSALMGTVALGRRKLSKDTKIQA